MSRLVLQRRISPSSGRSLLTGCASLKDSLLNSCWGNTSALPRLMSRIRLCEYCWLKVVHQLIFEGPRGDKKLHVSNLTRTRTLLSQEEKEWKYTIYCMEYMCLYVIEQTGINNYDRNEHANWTKQERTNRDKEKNEGTGIIPLRKKKKWPTGISHDHAQISLWQTTSCQERGPCSHVYPWGTAVIDKARLCR